MRKSVKRETQGGKGTTRVTDERNNKGKGPIGAKPSSHGGVGSDKLAGFRRNIDSCTTPFPFTNIPEDATRSYLWKVFVHFDSIGEVYVPKKLDKWGRHFGFVKFKEVGDEAKLENRLEKVWKGDVKLKVN